MHRIDGAGHVDHLFVAEDPATFRPPTEITPEIMNAFQEELATFIEWAGVVLAKGDNTQLKQALLAKFAGIDSAATKAGVQGQAYTAFTTTGATGAFALAPAPAIAAYAPGQRFRVKFHAVGNGADTINVSALGAKTLKQYDSTGGKTAAVIAANQLVDVEYDGVDMVMLDPLPPVSSQGNFAGLNSSNVSATLSLTDMGKLYAFYGSTAAQTLTLPAVVTVAQGKNAIIVNQASVAVTVKGNAAETIASNTSGAGQSLGNTIVLNPGDSIVLSSNGVGQWNSYGFASPGQFPNSLAANGYQKLPNGLILQWGSVGISITAGVGANTTVTLPIAFPAGFICAGATNKATTMISGSTVPYVNNASLSQILVGCDASGNGEAAQTINLFWFAIGY